MRRDDPFSVPDAGFEKRAGPNSSDKEFSQADRTPCTLKDWLRSPECAAELDKQRNKPIRAVVRFVNTPYGAELHIERGEVTKIYVGPRSELEKIARAHGGAA